MFESRMSITILLHNGEEFVFSPVRYDGIGYTFPYCARYNDSLVVRYEFNDVLHGRNLEQEIEQILAPKLGGYLQLTEINGVVLIEIKLSGIKGEL